MPENDPRVRVRTYSIVPTGYDDMIFTDKSLWTLEVRDGGSKFGWAVAHLGCTLSRDGEWDYEPIPSSRDDDYLRAHRFPLDEALSLALDAVDSVTMNGCTAAEADARIRARTATK